ncbi:MAG: hypothetical protein M1150_02190 [Patescibacteria group bacterium]|nr:hypothetical protein [Patescibacteria group bacterium]
MRDQRWSLIVINENDPAEASRLGSLKRELKELAKSDSQRAIKIASRLRKEIMGRDFQWLLSGKGHFLVRIALISLLVVIIGVTGESAFRRRYQQLSNGEVLKLLLKSTQSEKEWVAVQTELVALGKSFKECFADLLGLLEKRRFGGNPRIILESHLPNHPLGKTSRQKATSLEIEQLSALLKKFGIVEN